SMKPSDARPSPASYIGHVKNGTVVLDAHVSLREGQTVRVEPIGNETDTQLDREQVDRVHQLQQLFADWTEEDSKLSDEEADRLHSALNQSCRLSFRAPKLD